MTRPGFHTASVDAKQTHTCVHVAAGGNVFRSELFLLDAYQSHKVTIFYNSTAVQCGFLSASSSKLARIRWRRARPRWRPTTTRRPHPHVQEPEAPHARLKHLINLYPSTKPWTASELAREPQLGQRPRRQSSAGGLLRADLPRGHARQHRHGHGRQHARGPQEAGPR